MVFLKKRCPTLKIAYYGVPPNSTREVNDPLGAFNASKSFLLEGWLYSYSVIRDPVSLLPLKTYVKSGQPTLWRLFLFFFTTEEGVVELVHLVAYSVN